MKIDIENCGIREILRVIDFLNIAFENMTFLNLELDNVLIRYDLKADTPVIQYPSFLINDETKGLTDCTAWFFSTLYYPEDFDIEF